ncbi:uncharacterized protein LOC135225107 [Macrobrachium nipponense]|uniref:uncharacterized protein LOC135225107 n=1 Tax=Macrobrachium nipponense TaxID=159736 RepID=UPI0030C81DAF
MNGNGSKVSSEGKIKSLIVLYAVSKVSAGALVNACPGRAGRLPPSVPGRAGEASPSVLDWWAGVR